MTIDSVIPDETLLVYLSMKDKGSLVSSKDYQKVLGHNWYRIESPLGEVAPLAVI